LKWCEDNTQRLTKYEYSKDKQGYLLSAFQTFTLFEKDYRRCVHEVYVKQALKTKFNGVLVMEQTGFMDRQLGEFMQCVKASYNSEALFEQALLYSPDEVWSRIYRMADEFKHTWRE
jgi:hypothetical protein